jgi:hypothetical protein
VRSLIGEFAAAVAAVFALESLAYFGSGRAPTCVPCDVIEFGDREAAAFVAHRIDRSAAFS